jgi:hypothetical protein
MATRPLIKRMELSLVPQSIIKTGVNNEQEYLAPGSNGSVLKVISGVPTWSNDAGNFSGVFGTVALRDAGTDLQGVLISTYGIAQAGNVCKVLDDGSLDANGTPDGIAKTYVWDGTQWVDFSIDPRTITQLTDVVITTPVIGDMLVWNGTDWVNKAPEVTFEENFIGLTTGESVTTANTINSIVGIYVNGVRQIVTEDYTFTGSVVTFTTTNLFAPSVGAAGSTNVTVIYK